MAEIVLQPCSFYEFRRMHPEMNGKEAEAAWNAWLDAYLVQLRRN